MEFIYILPGGKYQKPRKGPFLRHFEISEKIALRRKKNRKGTLWNLLTYIQLQNIKKLVGGPFETFKNSEKSRTASKKIEMETLWDLFTYIQLQNIKNS